MDFYFESDLKATALVLGSRHRFDSSQTLAELIQHKGAICDCKMEWP